MEHARHVLRMGLLLVLLVAGVVLARSLLLPKSFGKYGSYRFDNVAEQRNKPVMHHGAKSCAGCHEKQWKLREDGEAHLKVSCEVCHGPLAKHATGEVKDQDTKLADMPVDKTWKLCARCHRKLEGRPETVPQIVFDSKHLKGDKLEGEACKSCHDPHSTMYEEPEASGEETKP